MRHLDVLLTVAKGPIIQIPVIIIEIPGIIIHFIHLFQAAFACEAQHPALGAHNSPMRVTVVLSVMCKLLLIFILLRCIATFSL
jgi:hypothetical protein